MALGADEALDVVRAELGGVDASLVFSARMAGFRLGFDLLGLARAVRGRRPPRDERRQHRVQPVRVLRRRTPTIIYSAVGTVQDMRELIDLAAAGKVKSHVSRTGPLSELGDIFDELEAGRYLGRAVLTDLAH